MRNTSNIIKNLRDGGASWSEVFRQVIPTFPEGQDQRMFLFRELRETYGFDLATLLELGAWEYWHKGGSTDEQINQHLDERISAAPVEIPIPSHQRDSE